MPKVASLKPSKTEASPESETRSARRANTRDRAGRQTRKMQALEPAPAATQRPTRDVAGLEKVARLMSGLSMRAASAYADARVVEGDKYVRLSNAGYREAREIFEFILKDKKILPPKEQEDLILVMNHIKLLNVRVQDYAHASKHEAQRRESGQEWSPHPLGEDRQGFFARETY